MAESTRSPWPPEEHPKDAAPRSEVATVYYGLFGDDTPADRVPGDDGGARESASAARPPGTGCRFTTRLTANGERFDMDTLTAAHRTLPFPQPGLRAAQHGEQQEVLVRVNDRGPYVARRIIDLSRRGGRTAIDMMGLGIKQVALTLINRDTGGRCNGAAVTDSSNRPPERPVPVRRKAAACKTSRARARGRRRPSCLAAPGFGVTALPGKLPARASAHPRCTAASWATGFEHLVIHCCAQEVSRTGSARCAAPHAPAVARARRCPRTSGHVIRRPRQPGSLPLRPARKLCRIRMVQLLLCSKRQ